MARDTKSAARKIQNLLDARTTADQVALYTADLRPVRRALEELEQIQRILSGEKPNPESLSDILRECRRRIQRELEELEDPEE